MEKDKLYILWTNADPITSEKMVMMYATNAKLQGWWKEVTVIIWGSTAKLAVENELIKTKIEMAIHTGVKISACKACAEQLGVDKSLMDMGVEVKYWGANLTELLKEDETLLTI